MKTILVGIDFTKSSENSLNYAIKIAEQSHSKILLFHALTAPMIHSNSGLFFIAVDNITKNIEQKMKELQAQLSTVHKNIKFEIEITYEGIRNKVEALSKTHKISMVVLGLEVKNKLLKFLNGTTSLDLTGKINCPIITVPSKYKNHQVKKMIIALDLIKPIGLKISNNIHSIIKTLNVEPEFVHIKTNDNIDIKQLKYKHLNITEFNAQNFETGIKNYAKKSNADLIMVISHNYSTLHNLFKETDSQKIILSSRIPIISIHN
jgi:nucleotide-binding universal stress UspA family protein